MILNLRIYIAFLALAIAGSSHCDVVTSLFPIEPQEQLGTIVNSVNWCTCQFIAAGASGYNGNNGAIAIYQFDQTTGNLSQPGTTTTLGSSVNAVAWHPSCDFLAAGGRDFNNTAIIQLYNFNSSTGMLETVGTKTTIGGSDIAVTSLDWCNSYLAAAAGEGFGPFTNGILQVYSLDPEVGLSPIGHQIMYMGFSVDSIKWCSNCDYLAATISVAEGGTNPPSTLLIYTFDENTGDLVWTASFHSNSHYQSIDWCGNCGFIAAGGSNNIGNRGVIDIYKFDTQPTPSLAPVTSTATPLAGSIFQLEWCQDCENLAAAGSNGTNDVLQIYHFDPSNNTLSSPQIYPLSFPPPHLIGAIIVAELPREGLILFRGLALFSYLKATPVLRHRLILGTKNISSISNTS